MRSADSSGSDVLSDDGLTVRQRLFVVNKMVVKLPTTENSNNPNSVTPIPKASEYGSGRRSVYTPMSGCSSDAVT